MSALTRAERDELLRRLERLAEQAYGPGCAALATDALGELRAERARAVRDYLEGLPHIPVARCPFCGELVILSIDTFGLDGPWWDVDGPDRPPRACGHFLVLLGALHFHGHSPDEAAPSTIDEIRPGPEIPFVVPRLLALPNCRCTVTSAPVAGGRYTAYLIAYFADPPVPGVQRHQAWLRGSFTYRGPDGQTLWNTRNDPWDFDLEAWLRRLPAQVAWIAPGDTALRLETSADGCPYLNLPGRRGALSVRQGRVYEYAPPDGTPFDADIFE